jgi:hypothetical protein
MNQRKEFHDLCQSTFLSKARVLPLGGYRERQLTGSRFDRNGRPAGQSMGSLFTSPINDD